jgi:hypothetical protein
VTTVRLHGDGGIGTTYRNATRFLGKETQLTYIVEEFADRELIGFAVRTTPSPAWTP